MSQEKIDRYKQEKANRKKNLKKQRTMSLIRKGVLALACVALVGWLGYSAYDSFSLSVIPFTLCIIFFTI